MFLVANERKGRIYIIKYCMGVVLLHIYHDCSRSLYVYIKHQEPNHDKVWYLLSGIHFAIIQNNIEVIFYHVSSACLNVKIRTHLYAWMHF